MAFDNDPHDEIPRHLAHVWAGKRPCGHPRGDGPCQGCVQELRDGHSYGGHSTLVADHASYGRQVEPHLGSDEQWSDGGVEDFS